MKAQDMVPKEFLNAKAMAENARTDSERFFYSVYATFLNQKGFSIKDARELTLKICSTVAQQSET